MTPLVYDSDGTVRTASAVEDDKALHMRVPSNLSFTLQRVYPIFNVVSTWKHWFSGVRES